MRLTNERKAELVAGPYTRLLARHEEAAGDLYRTFADLLKEGREFWTKVAKEEHDHARIILGVDKKLRTGAWAFKRPAFTTATIASSLEWIGDQKRAAEEHGISMREALQLAINLENHMIESGFFTITDADTPRIMDALKSLENYTRAHAKRLQLEASRFKWRIVGRRRSIPRPPSAQDHANVESSIRVAQGNILGILVSMEEAVSGLYQAYGERFPSSRKFWDRLAADEAQHASILRGLYKMLERGSIFHNVGIFNPENIQRDIAFIIKSEFTARHGSLSLREAVSTALKAERCIAETGFFNRVTSDSREFQIIAKRLSECTQQHLLQIEDEASREDDAAKDSRPRR